MHGICSLSLIAVRKEPSPKSEMVSQILFGELFEILETSSSWNLIRTIPDHFEGWIANDQVSIAPGEFVKNYPADLCMVSDNVAVALEDGSQLLVTLLKGSLLPGVSAHSFKISSFTYSFTGAAIPYPADRNIKRVPEVALSYLNAPFLWGGRSPLGIDCSGLIQMVYKFCGVDLPREVTLQANMGEVINFLDEAKPGDIAFFDDEFGVITHTGILLGNGQIIHASGKVKIDKIDHQGIFDMNVNKYTHKLRIIKHL